MSEKKWKELRQYLGYKPSYKNRRYSLIQKIVEFFRTGKWRTARRTQMMNTGHRRQYKLAKRAMKNGKEY